ncbi:UNVERIFIED_CONTAM: protein -like, chloroplastic [Sesamum angustifolium]|uniref:Protein -like, chloroplastic n=1 Tax=Sesamum angustifolium TaxID=2727405 RepID=A0AAW2PQA2_9LAMI
MNFFNPNKPSAPAAAPPSQPQHPLQQAFTSLQNNFSNFFHNLQSNPPLKSPFFARIPNGNNILSSRSNGGTSSFSPNNYAMSAEAIEERLAGVPVYALSNGEKFVLVSGTNTGKNLGLFCFSEGDAETLLKHMKSVDPSMSSGSQVVAVALSKIFQLDVDGVALRLMPEASQIRNALTERKKAGIPDESFAGVPVFQSKSLILRSQNKRYRPVFFRKEDLEKSLSRASNDQKQLNPSLRQGDIQVAVLEDIITGDEGENHLHEDSSVSTWDDVVFIPPGFDVSTDPSRQY